ncbi:hypothetical protein F7D01_05835 [Erythrobacter sp. 3-20A1M]|uniref:hypothetical protein n=1 Tax=Erythrobacter sp. 3-20A1M TaxID=2653850 RepID=UPI001BFC570E|nr:hypothetical protein [Erythrobacter sp. 3-20A1M]QWC56679.1 hypothetical protein F7D01_05835 [Erythrobacter sp. 3-20A1M]
MTAQQDTAPSFDRPGPSLLDRLRHPKDDGREKRRSIAAHPLFSAFVAAWFAALLGIGVMLLPVALLEALVARSRIDSVIPAAAPPLGDTEHLLLALAFAAVGALLGLVLSRRVIASQEPVRAPAPQRRKPADRHRDAPVKRPISAIEELGEEGLGPVRDIVPARPERPAERHPATDDTGDFEPRPASGRGELPIPSFLRAPLSLDPAFAPFDPDTSFELAQTGLWRPVTDTPAPAPAMDRADEEPARHPLPEVEPALAQVPLEDLGWPAMLERFAQALSGAGERPQPRTDERLRAKLARAGNAIGAWPPRRSVPLDALENPDEIPSDPAETERALRRAIERLGRLSGAA